jgi:hypothetical protein
MNTLIIEPNSKGDYQLFVSLAKRLKVAFREEKTKSRTQKEKDEEIFFALAGSFDLPETSDELIQIIENSRTNKEIDTSWTK